MHCIAEIRTEPIGEGTSIGSTVKHACDLLAESGLPYHVHSMGTNVEGELDQVLSALARLHQQLHAEGIARLSTKVSLETRTDKPLHIDHSDGDPAVVVATD